jgi:peptidoglycan/LPS O-acetylase OafA/YrhL
MLEHQPTKRTVSLEARRITMVLGLSFGIVAICAAAYVLLLQLSIVCFTALLLMFDGFSFFFQVDAIIVVCGLVFLLVLRAARLRNGAPRVFQRAPLQFMLPNFLMPSLGRIFHTSADLRLHNPLAPLEMKDAP